MPLNANLFYWQVSIENPEQVGEDFYVNDTLIVDKSDYTKEVSQLRDLITTYCTLSLLESTSKIEKIKDMLLRSIDKKLMEVPLIQYTEFVAYWKCIDITFSIYRSLDNSKQRIKILHEILLRYCKDRRSIYDKLGYTHVIQQALYDSGKSRSKAITGNRKIETIVKEIAGQAIERAIYVEDLSNKNNCWMVISKDSVFQQIKERFNMNYEFGKINQGKVPDFLIKLRDTVFIIEAKHIKEGGGAQDKQVRELISFIRQQEAAESSIRYVAFMDGLYFNLLASAPPGTAAGRQREDIEESLQTYPSSYFVNTAGLRQLLKDAISP